MTTQTRNHQESEKLDRDGRRDFGSDLHLRLTYFTPASFAHPAKLHLGFLQWLVERYTRPGEMIADPMAGIGSVVFAATLQRNVIAREIEPRWLEILRANCNLPP